MHCAVIGAPIAHSLSPNLHHAFAKKAGIALKYTRILLDEARFEAQVQGFFRGGGTGLSVTSPGKMPAFALADVKTKRSIASNAANTLWQDATGKIHADNTDGEGLVRDLTHKKIVLEDAKVLILGAGGAVHNILPSLLAEKPACIHIYNRTASRAQALCKAFDVACAPHTNQLAYDLILNASGARTDVAYVLKGTPFCYDLSYDISGVTSFTRFAHKQGFKESDGFGMLVEQAILAFARFRQQYSSD